MWIRKTDSEIENTKIRNGIFFRLISHSEKDMSPIRLAIVAFLIIFFFELIFELFIGVARPRYPYGNGGLDPTIRFVDVPSRLHYYIFLALPISMLAFYVQYATKKANKCKDDKRLDYVCDKCNKLKAEDGILDCKCGGKFVFIDKMKWVNDD